MSKWIAEFDLEDGDTMPEHMDLEYKGAKIDFHCRPMWIPCSEKLPDNRVCVIVCFREWQQYAKRYIYSIVMGWYARKHSVRENVFSEWEADCDYDEDEDESYIQEGWYEFTTQGNSDLMNWYINAEVVAWLPLPEPYKGDE